MGDRTKGLYEKKEGPLEALKEPRSSVLYGDGKLEPYPMPESAILGEFSKAPQDPPIEPPDLPVEMIREDGFGCMVIPFVFMAGLLAMGCTTSFDSFDERDTEEDIEGDTWEVADSPDLSPDSLEVPDVVEDDGGGEGDTEGDIEEDTTDPCDYYPTWYRDMDMDGYGRDSETVCFPTQPEGYVDRGGDCCDARPEVNPGVMEWQDEPYVCPGESWDWNCDGEEEPRRIGASWDRCDPHCGADCYTMLTEEDCVESIWWPDKETAPCGAYAGYGITYCFWNAGSSHCVAGTTIEGQLCR